MSPKKMFYVMSGILVLLASFVVAGAIFGNASLQKKASQLTSLKVDNRTLEQQQLSLVQAKKDIDKYSDLERTAMTIVPQEKDQAKTVREIVNIANAASVKLSGIAFPSSNLGQAVPKPTSTDTSSSTPAIPISPLTQVKPVDNIKGLYLLEITVQSDNNNPVPYSKLIDFLSRLEQNRRTAQVTGITVQPAAKSRDLVTFNLVLDVYIKP